MSAKYWIKLYLEILDDPKMGRLPDYLFRRAIELFLAAGENGNDGALQPVPQLAWRLRLDEMKLRESLRALSEVGVVYEAKPDEWVVTNFQKRQDAASPTERVREFRKRNDIETKRYTKCNETCNVSETVAPYTEAEEESESDTESTSSPSPAREKISAPMPRGPLIDEREACRIYTAITGHTVPPSGQRGNIEQVIIDIFREHRTADATIQFLMPFWLEWNKRQYSPTNSAWLLEWAVTRQIPVKKGMPMVMPRGVQIAQPKRQAKALAALDKLEGRNGE